MDGWKIRRAVDLQEDSPPVERLRALATLSSRQAHDFVIVVLDGGKPADLTGMQPWLSMILPGRASLQKQVGSVQANVVSVTLPKTGYAERGDVSIILSLMDEDGQTQIPLYGCVIRVMEDSTDTIRAVRRRLQTTCKRSSTTGNLSARKARKARKATPAHRDRRVKRARPARKGRRVKRARPARKGRRVKRVQSGRKGRGARPEPPARKGRRARTAR